MKLNQLITTVCALAGLVFLAPSAKATLPYANGDLILGFRASGGAGGTTDYEVNLGNATTFVNASGSVSPNVGNIKADLDAIYGTGWNSRDNVFWSVSGVVQPGANGFSANTMFATREQPTVGVQSTPWTRPSTFGSAAPANKMVSMISASFGYAAGTNATIGQTESSNSSVGLIQPTTGGSCYASFQPGGANTTGPTAFGYFTATNGIEGTFANGTAGTVLDFYKVAPGSGASELVGTFSITDNAVVTFTPAGGGANNANVHFSANAFSGSEAIQGGQIAVTVTRDGNTAPAASVNFSTTNGTAVAGTDFTGQINTPVSFAGGEISKTVMVDVVHRPGFQGDRSFTVSLSSPGAGTAITSPSSATVTIQEIDPNAGVVGFSAGAYQGPEVDGQSGLSVVAVTLSRTSGTTGVVSADLAVTGGTLVNGTDYNTVANPTTVSFGDGVATATFNLQLKAIAPAKLPGTIVLGLSNPTNGALLGATTSATVTINPVNANVHFASTNFSGSEIIAGGQIAVDITRDGNTAKPFTVNFSTANGTALAGTDYTAQTNVPVSFAAGDTLKTVLVGIAHRVGFQGNRALSVSLTNPTTGAVVNAPGTATVTILEDEAAPAGVLAFSAATFQANALNGANGPNLVPVTFTRSNGATGSVTVDVAVTGGTLISGTDYHALTTPTTISFADGATTATLNLQLNTIAANQLPGTIVLAISNPTNGATLGALTTATLTIVSPGVLAFSAPTYTFNPVDNHAAAALLPITVTRTGGVNGAVSANLAVTGGSLASPTDFDALANPTIVSFAAGAVTATVHIQLRAIPANRLPGTILLSLATNAGSAIGAPAAATVTVTKPDLAKPTVTATAPLAGGIVPSPFTLSGKALDAKGIDRVEVTLNGGPVQLATLGTFANGKVTYSLAGLAPENGKNTLSITAVDTSGNRSLPLVVAVKYLNNRPEFAGGYNGLLVPAVTPSNNVSGLLTLSVTATGTFTGKLALGGLKLPLSGLFGNDGKAHFKPGSLTSFALTPATLGSLELSVATDPTLGARVTGSLKSDPLTVAASLSAPRNFFNAKTPSTTVDTRYTLANKGKFTLVFPAQPQGALPATDFPQGDGYANLTLTATGAVTIAGKLADGVAFSAAAKLAADYSFPFFAALPPAKGSLAGAATFDDSQAGTDLSGPGLLWIRAAKPTSKYYPAGWPAGLSLELAGAKYLKPVGASVLPNLQALNPTTGNATLVFSDGTLTAPLTKNLNVAPTNLVTNVPPTDKSFTLLINKATGQISGLFKHTDNTRPAYSGIIFQKGPTAGAYGFFLSTPPLTPPATGQSGGVSLNAK